jgi:hypothetical protein
MMRTYKIGRGEGNDVVLADKTVSRNHAELTELGAGRFRLVDLGSTYGTKVEQGGQWVEAKAPVEIFHDTRVQFGDLTVTVGEILRDTDKTRVNPGAMPPPLPAATPAAAPAGAAARPAPPPRPAPAPAPPRPGVSSAGTSTGGTGKALIWGLSIAGVLLIAAVVAVVLLFTGDKPTTTAQPGQPPAAQPPAAQPPAAQPPAAQPPAGQPPAGQPPARPPTPPAQPPAGQPPAPPAQPPAGQPPLFPPGFGFPSQPGQPPAPPTGQPQPPPAQPPAPPAGQPAGGGPQRLMAACTQRWQIPQATCQCVIRACQQQQLTDSEYDGFVELFDVARTGNQQAISTKLQQMMQSRGQESTMKIVRSIQAAGQNCK